MEPDRDFMDPESQHFRGVEIAYDKIILWHVNHVRLKLSQERRGGRWNDDRKQWEDDTREEVRNSVDTLLDLVEVLTDTEYVELLTSLHKKYDASLAKLEEVKKKDPEKYSHLSYASLLNLKSLQFRAVLGLLYRKGFLGVTPEERSVS